LVPPRSKSVDADKFYQKQAKKHYFCLALILTNRLYPNAGTSPPASTEPTVRQVTSFDYWQSVHCRIKADVSQSRNMSGQHWPGSMAGILLMWVGLWKITYHAKNWYNCRK